MLAAGIVTVCAAVAILSWWPSPGSSPGAVPAPAAVDGAAQIEPLTLDIELPPDGRVFVAGYTFVLSGQGSPAAGSVILSRAGKVQEQSLLGDGRFSFTLTVNDNTSDQVEVGYRDGSDTTRLTLVADHSDPVLEIVSPAADARQVAEETFDVVVRVTDDNLDWVRIGNRYLSPAPDGTWVGAFIPLQEGDNIITITARDLAGRVGQHEIAVIRDTALPDLVRAKPAVGSELKPGPSVPFELWFSEDVASVTLEGVAFEVAGSRATGVVPCTARRGDWSLDGWSHDAAGNASEFTLSYQITRAPVRIEIRNFFGNPMYSSQAAITLAGVVHDAESREVRVTHGGRTNALTIDEHGEFTWDLTLDDGMPEVVAIEADDADDVRLEIILDTQAPMIDVLAPTPRELWTARGQVEVRVRVHDEHPAWVRAAGQDLSAGTDGIWSGRVRYAGESGSPIMIEAADLAHNRSTHELLPKRPATAGLFRIATPRDGMNLRRTIRLNSDIEIKRLTRAGRALPVTARYVASLELDVTDSYSHPSGMIRAQLQRTFLNIEQTVNSKVNEHDVTIDHDSDLEGRQVVFRWDAQAVGYLPHLVGDARNPALLDDLTVDLDMRGLLPDREVQPGEQWAIKAGALVPLLAPGGNLKLRPAGPRALTTVAQWAPFLLSGVPSGTCRAMLTEIRDADTAPQAAVYLEFDVQWTKDVKKQVNADLPVESRFSRLEMTISIKGEGYLLWDLSGGYLRQLQLDEQTRILRRGEVTLNEFGVERIVETVEDMAGHQVLTITAERVQ